MTTAVRRQFTAQEKVEVLRLHLGEEGGLGPLRPVQAQSGGVLPLAEGVLHPPQQVYQWMTRYGKVNGHDGGMPRDFWLADWERQAILDFQFQHPDDGYRRLTYMMIDADVVAVSPSTAYRVLGEQDRLRRWNSRKATSKGKGPQFIAKDFKEFIRICGVSRVRTSPYYPQSNGWAGRRPSQDG